jgi:RHS repeat-associated protein
VSVTGSRGNVTTIAQLVSGTTTLGKTSTYFDTGNVHVATDVNAAQTTYSYGSSSCGNSFATSISEPMSLSRSMGWNCSGGVQSSVTDENGNTISYNYTTDPDFWRPNSLTDQESNTTNYTYTPASSGVNASVVSSLVFNSSNSAVNLLTTFDGLGRKLVSQTEHTPTSTSYDSIETDYDNGAPDALSAQHGSSSITGFPTITYGVEGEGRTYSASASSGQNPLSSTTYNPASQPLVVTLGSSDSDTFGYDPNTDRMTSYAFDVNGQSVVGTLTWNAIATLGKLVITDPFDSANAQTCTYTHDDLLRIASDNCGSGWSQTMTYDAFGNLNKSGTMSFQPTYSTSTNQMTAIGSSTPTYDSNGNVTDDFLHAYAWDANGRPVTVDGVSLTYDALGSVVEQGSSGTYSQIIYGPSGSKLAVMQGSTLQKAFVPLSGGSVAVYNSSGLDYYRHSDWLGNSRFASTPTGTNRMYYDGAYGPFGEAYAGTGTTDLSFTGMDQDTVANLYDFPARETGTQGRWPSPDPAGLATVNPSDPQSWNRYAYVENRALSLTDPTGLLGFQPSCMASTKGDGLSCSGWGVNGNCNVDGASGFCGPLGGNGMAQCPNNNCGIGTSTPYQCIGEVCEYMSQEYANTHENEWGGVLYSGDEWDTFLTDRQEAQQEALADAIAYASNSSNGANWDAIYNSLVYVTTVGGNAEFRWDSSATGLSLDSLGLPDNLELDSVGCEYTCRDGIMPSIHFDNSMFHLDTASASGGLGALIIHGLVDVLIGSINPTVPFAP